MKNIFKSGIFALITFFALTACDPQDGDDYSLGTPDTITDGQVSFTYAPTSKSDNEIVFTPVVDSNNPTSVSWNLGNGTVTKERITTGQYPEAGDYTVVLTVYAADGSAATKSQVIHIEKDDFSLIDTPVYRNLTGGTENTAGKTWVFDQYNNFSKEVADATGNDIKGHIGLGESGSYSQNWWGAGPDEKNGWTMYAFKFNFKQAGVKLNIQNEGKGYGRNATSESQGKFAGVVKEGEDASFNFAGGDYTFSIDESGEYPKLSLSGNAFMGYYVYGQDYEIIYQTDEVMALRVNNPTEGQDWVFIYCLEELNVAEPPVVKDPKAVPLFDDFEGEAAIVWALDAMGDRTGVSDNPNFTGNSSTKVYRYEKSTASGSNIIFTAPDYKFDLTKQNKIKLKVLMPSFNDYTTENGKESWAPSAKLLPKLAVKLYNSSSSEPWNDGKILEKELTADQLDKWVELVFDFSEVSGNQNYDQIVIQFGQEGHFGTGIFYFDDFTFSE